jgi:colanic acid biosynthesis protein WcaH
VGLEQSIDATLGGVLERIPDPSSGLPDAVFRFALKIVPMITVDLLVRNEQGEHLLAWREDAYDAGWHIPGGIIRYNESFATRIAAVAENELSATVTWQASPVEVKELFGRRGHFVSLLYLCRLATPVRNDALWFRSGSPRHGQLAWLSNVPADIYRVHATYKDWLCGRAG